MAVSFDKIEEQAPGLVSLAKEAAGRLAKRGLYGERAKVALALDFSGSMRSLYRDGTVQRLAERVLALGTQLDDDGAIDVFLFDSGADYVGELGLSDYKGGVDRLTAGRRMGSTNYAELIATVRRHYAPEPKKGLFRKSVAGPMDLPAYVMFVTDGEPDSRSAAERELIAASGQGIFWQFMGVGGDRFPFLEKLDDLRGRELDNANFFSARDVDRLSDADLYTRMLTEYPHWLQQARNRGFIL